MFFARNTIAARCTQGHVLKLQSIGLADMVFPFEKLRYEKIRVLRRIALRWLNPDILLQRYRNTRHKVHAR